jgi:iron-sulfur cluster assembly protein
MSRDVVTITEAARSYINQRCDGVSTIVGVKINNKGCSGHSYEYSLIDPSRVGPMDETILWPGGGLSISALSVMYLLGSTLDTKISDMEEYLVWENPQVTDHCGCGSSFSLRP